MTLLSPEVVRIEALVAVRILDSASGDPLMVRRVRTPDAHVGGRAAPGGFVVLFGTTSLALPDLVLAGGTLHADVEVADVATPLELTFAIPAGAALPLRPADLLVDLQPTALTGSVYEGAAPHGPIADATVHATFATGPGALVALGIPASVGHPPGAAVTPRTLAPAAPATSITAPANAGALQVELLSVAGCAGANKALVLGEPAGAEPLRIVAVAAKTVTLASPLRRSRPAGAPARAHTVAAAGAATALTREARAGDGVIALAAAALPVGTDAVDVGGPTPELRPHGATSDATGRWRIDGIRAAGQLDVSASATGFTTATERYRVDYRRPNVLEFSLEP